MQHTWKHPLLSQTTDQVSFCVIQDTALASEQLPSRAGRVTAAMVGRAQKSPLHFPCPCEALDGSPNLPSCLRWQWAMSILPACSPARPAGSPMCWGWQSLWDSALHPWDRLCPWCTTKPPPCKWNTTSLFFTLPLQSLLTFANPEWLPSS